MNSSKNQPSNKLPQTFTKQHMIVGMNSSAIAITILGTFVLGNAVDSSVSFGSVYTFLHTHPDIRPHIFLYCVCGAIGQYVIYFVIQNFGAVTFAKMMLLRQMVSVVVSIVVNAKGNITGTEVLGLFIMFTVLAVSAADKKGKKGGGGGGGRGKEAGGGAVGVGGGGGGGGTVEMGVVGSSGVGGEKGGAAAE